MKGMRMCIPASRTPLKRPKRSTTYALCWGTTVMAFTRATKRRRAPAPTTTTAASIITTFLFRDEPESEPLDAAHAAALSLGEGPSPVSAGVPRGPPELCLSHLALPDVLEEHGLRADDAVDRSR